MPKKFSISINSEINWHRLQIKQYRFYVIIYLLGNKYIKLQKQKIRDMVNNIIRVYIGCLIVEVILIN